MGLFAGYVRVSRVGDRAETLISPKLQQRQIEAWASAHGHRVEMLPPELDASGGDDERPVLLDAIGRVERGELDGIVVWKADRFTRSLRSSLAMLERVESAGGQFRSASEQLDPSTPEGRMWRNMVFSMAQMEREHKAEGFERSKADAIARGVYIAGRPPRGYRVGADRRLEPIAEWAPVIRDAFKQRAAGQSWAAVAQFMAERMGQPFLPASVRTMIRNPAYTGEARQGKHRNPTAHPAIVDRALWEAAQLAHPRPPRGKHGPGLLVGLARCAGCSRRMTSSVARGRRFYSCTRHGAGGKCAAAAIISASVERIVTAAVLAHLADLHAKPRETTDALDEAQRELAEAEAELGAFVRATKAAGVGEQHFAAGMRQRVEAIEDARRGLASAHLAAAPVPDAGLLPGLWGEMSVEERRHVLRGTLSVVWIRRGPGAVADRVRLIAAGHAPVGLPRRGVASGPPVALDWTKADLPGEIVVARS